MFSTTHSSRPVVYVSSYLAAVVVAYTAAFPLILVQGQETPGSSGDFPLREAKTMTASPNFRTIVAPLGEDASGTEAQAQFMDHEILVRFRGEEGYRRIVLPADETVAAAVATYRTDDAVADAEPNYIAYALMTPNDTYFSYQWHLDNPQNRGIHMQDAWNISAGAGTVVAVIDTGIAYENYTDPLGASYYRAPDLANTTFVPGYDFVNNDTHPNDDESHGTHVAGTIAQSTSNNLGVAGIAYQASIMPVKVLDANGSGTYQGIADGIRWATDHGAKVINMSFGGPAPSAVLEDALAYAYNAGVTLVAAAGNDGASSALYPAAYNQYVIAVGATRYDRTRAPYSDFGPDVDIVAPGGDMTVDQNLDGYGDGVLQQTFGLNVNDWAYYFFQGTSMASPHVAGVAALIISKGIATTPDAVRNVLQSTADDLGTPGRDNTYGWGLVNAAAALGVATPANHTPVITSSPVTTASVGAAYTYDVNATDADTGDTIAYALTTAPSGMSINAATGLISWTPVAGQTGAYPITASVTDGKATATQSYTLTVTASGQITVFSETFESNLNQWTQDSQNDWFRSKQRATDGKYSAEVDGLAQDSTLISKAINLQGKTTANITFSWFMEGGFDLGEYMAFDISTDGGVSWVEKARIRGDVDPENVWQAVTLNLSGVNALKIRFRGKVSDSSEDGDVDGVRVTAQ